MPDYLQYLVFLGAAVQMFGYASYIKETLKGGTKPNKVSWLMWPLATLIAAVAGLKAGAGWVVLPVFMSGFGALLVFIASFLNKNSYWKLEIFDYLCGLFSFLALILWAITREPIVAIIFAIASDGFASIPTLIKSWKHPETETVAPYTTGLFNALTSFAALRTFGFAEYAFPSYLVFIDTLLILSVWRKRFYK